MAAERVDIFAIRHAPAMRADGSLVSGEVYGHTDYDADVSNRAQFEAVAARLPSDAPCIVSTLKRTQQTAEALGLQPVGYEAAFNEQAFGDWERMPVSEIPEKSSIWKHYHSYLPPGDGAERWCDVRARVRDIGIPRLVEAAGETGKVILVSHHGALQALVAEALDMPDAAAFALQIKQVSLTSLSYFPGHGRWQLKQLAWLP